VSDPRPAVLLVDVELERAQFDLALLDHHLTGERGVDLVPTLRALPRRPLIVVLSGRDRIESGEIDACITKGVPSSELLARLEQAQRRKGLA
jgi:DNA-binding response OmpR family regulator